LEKRNIFRKGTRHLKIVRFPLYRVEPGSPVPLFPVRKPALLTFGNALAGSHSAYDSVGLRLAREGVWLIL